MFQNRRFSLFVCLSLLFPAVALAEKEIELGDLLITPRRIPGMEIDASRYAGNATVITEEAIRTSGAHTIIDLLSQYEGVSVVDSAGFGLGADAGVNLRGFVNTSRTNALVLVNGVRQNRITGDEVHWVAIPIELIERIEIIRGGGGTIYGEGALAGVINITTKKGGERPIQMEGSAQYGSYENYRTSSVIRGSQEDLSYSLGVTRQESGGYRDHTDSRGTTVNLFGGWTPWAETDIEVNIVNHEDTTGFAGGLTAAQVEQNRKGPGGFFGVFADEQQSAAVHLAQQVGEDWTTAADLAWSRRESDSITSGIFTSLSQGFTGGVRTGHQLNRDRWDVTSIMGLDWIKDKATTGSRTGTKSESNRWAYGLFLEESIQFYDKLTLTLGYRYDKSGYEEDLTFPAFQGTLRFSGRSPKVGVNYQVSDDLSVYGSAARTFKAPNIDDLDAVLPPYNDSPNVQPQQADHYEMGARWNAAPWAQVKGAGFVIHTQDEILFNALSFANSNFTTRRAGMELNVNGTLPIRNIVYYAAYTLSEAHFHKGTFTGNSVPLTPMHRGSVGLRIPMSDRLTADFDAIWIGKQFRANNFNNQLLADKYGVVNGSLEYRLPDKLKNSKLYFRLLNLLDEEYTSFQSSSGTAISTGENPSPPRTWLVGISWEL